MSWFLLFNGNDNNIYIWDKKWMKQIFNPMIWITDSDTFNVKLNCKKLDQWINESWIVK